MCLHLRVIFRPQQIVALCEVTLHIQAHAEAHTPRFLTFVSSGQSFAHAARNTSSVWLNTTAACHKAY
jgi:hypothetical protein